MFTSDSINNVVPVYSSELTIFTPDPFCEVLSTIGTARCNVSFMVTNPFVSEVELSKLIFEEGELYNIVLFDTGFQGLQYKDYPLYLTITQDYFEILPANFTPLPIKEENPMDTWEAPVWST